MSEANGRRVLKWVVPVDDAEHEVPGRFVAANALGVDEVNVWTEVVTGPVVTWPSPRYRVFGTGQPVDPGFQHRATVQAAPFVWHVYSKSA